MAIISIRNGSKSYLFRGFLNPEELRLAKYALLGFRNKLVAQDKPTEDINALLLKIMK